MRIIGSRSNAVRLSAVVSALVCLPLAVATTSTTAVASSPGATTFTAPTTHGTKPVKVVKTFTGTIPLTGAVDASVPCTPANCDTHALHMQIPANYWKSHVGGLKLAISWGDPVSDLDITVIDSQGSTVGSAATSDNPEQIDLGQLPPGDYEIDTASFVAQPGISYTGTLTLTTTNTGAGMQLPEDKSSLMNDLTIHYPLRVVFAGRTPSKAEIRELKAGLPKQYQPTVANNSESPDAEGDPAGASTLVNWNTVHYTSNNPPYFLGMRYKYDIQVLQASTAYTKAIFAQAEKHTARDQSYHDSAMTAQQVQYDNEFGKYRVAANGPDYAVADPTHEDLIDSYAVEDWIFHSRTHRKWHCAFTDVATGKCVSAAVIQDSPHAYHDPYYDKHGRDLDTMPQGVNKGSTTFFFDTFTPKYAKDYFRPNAYHVWGTDQVKDGRIVAKPIEQGGSWRITDPDTRAWSGVDYARTWGGRYRFHYFDLGAAPNNYEDVTWANYGAAESNAYPQGDPPVWEYDANPLWSQSGDDCQDAAGTHYTGNVPCRIMPRLARDVAYQLFFRSTAGYLYRPIPKGDVYWLATTNFTDFYSRPQWVNGALTGTPYGTWWSDLRKLYQAEHVGGDEKAHDDTLRWLSSATPYTRWIGRIGEKVKLYSARTNEPTGKTLDASPKFADLPAPEYHAQSTAVGVDLLPEPLYGGEHVYMTNRDGTKVDLTELQNIIEKAKMSGLTGAAPDDSVNTDVVRDYVDAHRKGLADIVKGVGTIPSVNMVFEKAFTWALPAIVGGIAIDDKDGNAWGVLNNVNDRFKWCGANYPVYDPTANSDGDKVSLLPCHPKQETGTGFSYTIEHEAAHSLGLSHPHDGSYGVDKCPPGDPKAGQWKCYWAGQGWVMDISAAPTTYAMAYRPYEVEDQDNLQRGHVAEYLLAGQTSLQTELLNESKAGRTTPSAEFDRRYAAYKRWKKVAVHLFRRGDYLHAEYAARDAALAAKGVRQTPARTIDPRLVGAGQVFYFRINPQTTERLSY